MTKLILALALGACSSSAQSTGISNATCPPDSTLTYENFGSTFISDNCLSCHATKDSPRLMTKAQIQANKSRILQEAVYTDAMPENANMDVAEREMLGEWLACGAP